MTDEEKIKKAHDVAVTIANDDACLSTDEDWLYNGEDEFCVTDHSIDVAGIEKHILALLREVVK